MVLPVKYKQAIRDMEGIYERNQEIIISLTRARRQIADNYPYLETYREQEIAMLRMENIKITIDAIEDDNQELIRKIRALQGLT